MSLDDEELEVIKQGRDALNTKIDKIVRELFKADTDPMACMIIDSTYRSFMHWFTAARYLNVDLETIRQSLVLVVNMIAVEYLTKVKTKDENGNELSPETQATELINDVLEEIKTDLLQLGVKKDRLDS